MNEFHLFHKKKRKTIEQWIQLLTTVLFENELEGIYALCEKTNK